LSKTFIEKFIKNFEFEKHF